MTLNEQIEKEARELYSHDWNQPNLTLTALQQAYIAGAMKYAPKWRPVEEAPKDKITTCLFAVRRFPVAQYGYINREHVCYREDYDGGYVRCIPDGFMPLPELPALK